MAMIFIDGINIHHKFKISLKKPLGGGSSVLHGIISHPLPTLLAPGLGTLAQGLHDNTRTAHTEATNELGRMLTGEQQNQDALSQLSSDEENKRRALGQQQQQQILGFANEQEGRVADYRKLLAQHLSDTAQQTFTQANPGLLEDLNSRGLFTSQTARDDSQNRALQQLANEQQNQLSNFDTSQFNNINDIRGSGLSALLGGNQSALDSALELRKAGIQRSFDLADQQRQLAFAQMLAGRQNRQQLTSSLLGLGGTLVGGFFGGPGGASVGGGLGRFAGSSFGGGY